MSQSQWDQYLSNAAVPRVKKVSDPVYDIARDNTDDETPYSNGRWEYIDQIQEGFSNFNLGEGKVRLETEK